MITQDLSYMSLSFEGLAIFMCSYGRGQRVNSKMVQFTKEERVFMVECYILTQSPNEVIRQFRGSFPFRNAPTTKVTYRKYHTFGTSCNMNKGNSGHHQERMRTCNMFVKFWKLILETGRLASMRLQD